jgi:hypothetical protein
MKTIWYPHTIVREHPFEMMASYRFIAREPKLGHVPLYKVASRLVSGVISIKEKVPNSKVYYAVSNGDGSVVAHPDTTRASEWVCVVAWTRRHNIEEVSEAVATLLMLSDRVVVIRAFDP